MPCIRIYVHVCDPSLYYSILNNAREIQCLHILVHIHSGFLILIGSNGAVRLTGGLVPQQGNVEVCLSGSWSRVCDRNWDYKDSFVVCRQLGYPATQAGTIHVSPCIIIMKTKFFYTL